jgi:long-chain acyl-CoA synthetase
MAGIDSNEIKNYYFYATEEHVQGSLRRWFAAHHNIILMERRNLKNSIAKMAEVLRQGKNLVIFPEGRRTNTGALGDFKKTFAILSQELQVPILPVCIRGAYDALPRERTFPSTAHIEIEYLPMVQPSEAATPEELAELVKQRIAKVL